MITLARAQRVTGLSEKVALVREGLRALSERESTRRLAQSGGSPPRLKAPPSTARFGMIPVDSSVEIDQLRAADHHPINQLNGRQVLVHPFVIGGWLGRTCTSVMMF
jgi:hypothetical protein